MRYNDKYQPPLTPAEVGHAIGSLGFVLAIVVSAVLFTSALRDHRDIEAQQIIQAGRTLAGQVGR